MLLPAISRSFSQEATAIRQLPKSADPPETAGKRDALRTRGWVGGRLPGIGLLTIPGTPLSKRVLVEQNLATLIRAIADCNSYWTVATVALALLPIPTLPDLWNDHARSVHHGLLLELFRLVLIPA